MNDIPIMNILFDPTVHIENEVYQLGTDYFAFHVLDYSDRTLYRHSCFVLLIFSEFSL